LLLLTWSDASYISPRAEKKRKHVKKREQTIRRSLSPVVFRPTEDFHQDSYSERSSLKKSKHSQR